ncbi:MAG: 2-amino-4-hydroxy-6-hydroxymethyldihydropteridine diphosphokinase [Burkholderiales bacterium]|nr:2-amino-4-hydroxy-6-hydroxymethyldihydropteridine diphosphokinase [Burkholderiales bacterium]
MAEPQIPPRFRALVGMGGNLGDVAAQLRSALSALETLPWTRVEGVSSVYQTAPVDASGPDYLNAVVALQSALGPEELLRALLQLECDHDRTRPYRHAPRTLDLDLLWFGGAQRDTATLTLPHPRMLQRAFVLEPLSDLLDTQKWPWPADLPRPTAQERQFLAQQQGIAQIESLHLAK